MNILSQFRALRNTLAVVGFLVFTTAAGLCATLTNTVTFNFQDMLQSNYTNRAVSIRSKSTPATNGTVVIVNYFATNTTGSAGQFILTNLYSGTYEAQIVGTIGGQNVTKFDFTVPTNQDATHYVSSLITTTIVDNATTAWTKGQANTKFVSLPGTNMVFVTNNGLVTANSTASGSSTAVSNFVSGAFTNWLHLASAPTSNAHAARLADVLTASNNLAFTNSSTLYVTTNGSDATGLRGKMERPFLSVPAAMSNRVAGDLILIGPGDFNMGTNFLRTSNDVTLRGSGMFLTRIQNSNDALVHTTPVVSASSNLVIENLTIQGLKTNAIQFAFGFFDANAVARVKLRNVYLEADSYAVYLSSGNPTNYNTFEFKNCRLYSRWFGHDSDMLLARVEYDGCEIIIDGPSGSGGGQDTYYGAIFAGTSTATNIIRNTRISVSGPTHAHRGIYNTETATFVDNVLFDIPSANAFDLAIASPTVVQNSSRMDGLPLLLTGTTNLLSFGTNWIGELQWQFAVNAARTRTNLGAVASLNGTATNLTVTNPVIYGSNIAFNPNNNWGTNIVKFMASSNPSVAPEYIFSLEATWGAGTTQNVYFTLPSGVPLRIVNQGPTPGALISGTLDAQSYYQNGVAQTFPPTTNYVLQTSGTATNLFSTNTFLHGATVATNTEAGRSNFAVVTIRHPIAGYAGTSNFLFRAYVADAVGYDQSDFIIQTNAVMGFRGSSSGTAGGRASFGLLNSTGGNFIPYNASDGGGGLRSGIKFSADDVAVIINSGTVVTNLLITSANRQAYFASNVTANGTITATNGFIVSTNAALAPTGNTNYFVNVALRGQVLITNAPGSNSTIWLTNLVAGKQLEVTVIGAVGAAYQILITNIANDTFGNVLWDSTNHPAVSTNTDIWQFRFRSTNAFGRAFLTNAPNRAP